MPDISIAHSRRNFDGHDLTRLSTRQKIKRPRRIRLLRALEVEPHRLDLFIGLVGLVQFDVKLRE
jgi:hypothetical protein